MSFEQTSFMASYDIGDRRYDINYTRFTSNLDRQAPRSFSSPHLISPHLMLGDCGAKDAHVVLTEATYLAVEAPSR